VRRVSRRANGSDRTRGTGGGRPFVRSPRRPMGPLRGSGGDQHSAFTVRLVCPTTPCLIVPPPRGRSGPGRCGPGATHSERTRSTSRPLSSNRLPTFPPRAAPDYRSLLPASPDYHRRNTGEFLMTAFNNHPASDRVTKRHPRSADRLGKGRQFFHPLGWCVLPAIRPSILPERYPRGTTNLQPRTPPRAGTAGWQDYPNDDANNRDITRPAILTRLLKSRQRISRFTHPRRKPSANLPLSMT